MGEGAGGERCDWLRELPAEAVGPPPPPLRSGLGCGGAGAAALRGGRERRGPARGVRPETAPRARGPPAEPARSRWSPSRRGARCRRRARCRSVTPMGARGDASGPRGSSRSCGRSVTRSPPCPELKALRSPAPRPRGGGSARCLAAPRPPPALCPAALSGLPSSDFSRNAGQSPAGG